MRRSSSSPASNPHAVGDQERAGGRCDADLHEHGASSPSALRGSARWPPGVYVQGRAPLKGRSTSREIELRGSERAGEEQQQAGLGDIACARSPPRRSAAGQGHVAPALDVFDGLPCRLAVPASPLPLLLGSAAVPRLPRGAKDRASGTMARAGFAGGPATRLPRAKAAGGAQLAGACIPRRSPHLAKYRTDMVWPLLGRHLFEGSRMAMT
ncbi:unnamed protein product [Urochloa humidicola]